MVTEIGASHASDTQKEQKIRRATHFRHCVPSVGLHVHNVRESGDHLTLNLASRSRLRLGLCLGRSAEPPLLLNLVNCNLFNMRVLTISFRAARRGNVSTTPFVLRGIGFGFPPPFSIPRGGPITFALSGATACCAASPRIGEERELGRGDLDVLASARPSSWCTLLGY
jgi:hypothetical protein